MNISFPGVAREVTGSCYLIDGGMVQGGREAPARNRKPFGRPKGVAVPELGASFDLDRWAA